MKIKFLAFIFLFVGCKSKKEITHPLLRTDGFYYRQKQGDVYQYVRFFTNGRVVVSRRLSKPELFKQYPNSIMRNVDTSSTATDTKKSSFRIKNDSVFFIKKPDNHPVECYDISYAFKLLGDSMVGKLEVVNFDSTVLQTWQFGKTDIKREKTTSFKFIKASYNKKKKYPLIPYQVYNVPTSVVNGKMVIEEL